MPVIVISGREYDGHQVEITGGHLTIGRATECDIVLHDKEVSSHHARIVIRDRVCHLVDLGSTNGTFFGNKPVAFQALTYNDKFRIGDYHFTLAESGDAYDQEAEASMDELRKKFHEELIAKLNLRKLSMEQLEDKSLRKRASDALDDLLKAHARKIPAGRDHALLKKAVLDAALGLGPLEDLLADDTVTEIMVNGPQKIYVERSVNGKARVELAAKSFLTKHEILTTIERIVGPIGRRIDESSPTVDARLRDGSRVHAIIPPLALDSPTITIRKFPKTAMTAEALVGKGSLSAPMAAFLKCCVETKQNIVVSGGTGTGKTTLLNVMGAFIPEGERIITIEDSAELRLPQDHVVRLETRPPNIEKKGAVTIRDLVRNALRMRPNRILVGECRGGEALDMLQAMNTGHDGSLTTVHANSTADAIRRLENLVLFGGGELPLRAVRDLIFSAVNIIIQIRRFPDGSKKVTAISEMASFHEGEIHLQDIFEFCRFGDCADGTVLGQHSATGVIPAFISEHLQFGNGVDMSIFVPTVTS